VVVTVGECRQGPHLILGLWGSVVELEQHYMPINTASLCHKKSPDILIGLSLDLYYAELYLSFPYRSD
jgi:hypothetical protein